jgi:hypothetical protein
MGFISTGGGAALRSSRAKNYRVEALRRSDGAMNPTGAAHRGNWKMYHGGAHGVSWRTGSRGRRESSVTWSSRLVYRPRRRCTAVKKSPGKVEVAAQNLHPKSEGAFTEGERTDAARVGLPWVIMGIASGGGFRGNGRASVKGRRCRRAPSASCVEKPSSGKTLDVVFRQLDAFAENWRKRPGTA